MLQNGQVFHNGEKFCDFSQMSDEVSPAPPIEGLMWAPPSVKNHSLTKIRQKINQKYKVQLEDYHQLHKWSCENYDQFWKEVWEFCEIIGNGEISDVAVDKNIPIQNLPKWFPGIKMNYAENLLR